ncbi:phosphoribosyltransferase family protein [Kitasatospora sp. MAP5-34]|uniref:phosphoribosyltransferase family protein n=1 Tax=Kitasatospora sp. MAP5-34 TaxID=3035102 RepID=UPI002472FCE1|nr:phosphoribosyltransferase family protein [Kitasatospora sp. MAP5-34]MDH6575368.1 putative phosphoribosyl transferase [Kitasatospora sp. MAP5-34]
MYYSDRTDAGRRLAAELTHLRGADPVVVGLPRGGVPVAAEVAGVLGAPLDICVIRKLGVPVQPELGMGAIGEGGARVLNERVIRGAGVTSEQLARVEQDERAELERRAKRYRRGRDAVDLRGRTVVVVDDGIATGSSARAACQIVRARGAARVVLAVPVAPSDWETTMAGAADELVCPYTPSRFWAIGEFYTDFGQTDDAEVLACLEQAGSEPPRVRELEIRAPGAHLSGELTLPQNPSGVVLFAHGSGSSRFSPRNRLVAGSLNRAGLGTLLFDLLTVDEEPDRHKVFDPELLGDRLSAATRRLADEPGADGLPFGYFGASTGAAAALVAAAEPGSRVAAIVSRGGRPDLAGARLAEVRAPTLLIVGGADRAVLELNRQARALLHCESSLAVVPGATHLFEEPRALEAVAELAADWFTRWFSRFAQAEDDHWTI